jgi:hypothetical protein
LAQVAVAPDLEACVRRRIEDARAMAALLLREGLIAPPP